MTALVRPFFSRRTGLCILTVLTACAMPPEPDLALIQDEWQRLEQEKTPASDVPDFVKSALLSTPPPSTGPRQKRFDVSVSSVPAKTFFLSLVAESGINLVTHPDVDGTISLELKDVSVPEVLEVVRDIYGYEYRLQNNIYTIYPRQLRTEIFSVNYLDVRRVGVSDTNVAIGEIASASGGQRGGQLGGGGGGQQASGANILGLGGESGDTASGERINPGSRVQTLNRTDFWQSLDKTVQAIIGSHREGRMVMMNPQAGLVVVTAMPAELGAVRDFLTRSEINVKRQVILEAKILEVRLSKGFEAGVNWNSIQGQLLFSSRVGQFQSPTDIVQQAAGGTDVFSSIFKVADIRDLIALLETQGAVQVLSSPRVSTVNNQKAVIRVGSDEFFVTGISSTTTASAAATTSSPEVELAAFFSGISLDVTPQISENGDVILHIHPIVSDVTDQTKELVVGDSRFSLPLALREIRESDSIVRARSGQVVVLGGLMQEATNRRQSRFSGRREASSKTELVILLRPIVVEEDTWQQEISRYGESARALSLPADRRQ